MRWPCALKEKLWPHHLAGIQLLPIIFIGFAITADTPSVVTKMTDEGASTPS
jgi:hypothetical protein